MLSLLSLNIEEVLTLRVKADIKRKYNLANDQALITHLARFQPPMIAMSLGRGCGSHLPVAQTSTCDVIKTRQQSGWWVVTASFAFLKV